MSTIKTIKIASNYPGLTAEQLESLGHHFRVMALLASTNYAVVSLEDDQSVYGDLYICRDSPAEVFSPHNQLLDQFTDFITSTVVPTIVNRSSTKGSVVISRGHIGDKWANVLLDALSYLDFQDTGRHIYLRIGSDLYAVKFVMEFKGISNDPDWLFHYSLILTKEDLDQ
jgi:hypothetical protein